MANQWFRMYAEFSTDPKVQMLSETDQRRLVMIFCLRCNGNVTLQDEEVTFQLRISNEEWAATKSIFVAKGFIDSNNSVLNWNKRQYASDSSAERVARHRNKKKQECNVTVTPPDTEQNRTDISTSLRSVDTGAKKSRSQISKPDDVEKNVWDGFIAIRKAKRSPISQSAIDGIRRQATKAGITLESALQMCCERGWQGFNADWLNSRQQSANVQEARLEVADFIFGRSRNGTDNTIIDINPSAAIADCGKNIPALVNGIRESVDAQVAGR